MVRPLLVICADRCRRFHYAYNWKLLRDNRRTANQEGKMVCAKYLSVSSLTLCRLG